MKIYTEEELKFAMLSAYLTGVTRPPSYEEAEEVLFNSLTPIELPSDEDIVKQFTIGVDVQTEYPHKIEGAKWVINKILNK